jgi:chromosome segregation ATPase
MTIDERLEHLAGLVEAHDRRIEEHDRRIETVDSQIEKIVHIMEGFAVGMRRLEEAEARTEERLRHYIQVTEMAQLETTEKLNALIQTVDDWIRNHPPGGPAAQ